MSCHFMILFLLPMLLSIKYRTLQLILPSSSYLFSPFLSHGLVIRQRPVMQAVADSSHTKSTEHNHSVCFPHEWQNSLWLHLLFILGWRLWGMPNISYHVVCSAWNMGALILIGVDAIGVIMEQGARSKEQWVIVIVIISGIGIWPHHQALAHLSNAGRCTSATWANWAFIYSFT